LPNKGGPELYEDDEARVFNDAGVDQFRNMALQYIYF
jgi:hypothetical protein